MINNKSDGKWLEGWPTPEQTEAHAEAHGKDGRGCWLIKTAVSFCPQVTQITCRTPTGEPFYTREGRSLRCSNDGWRHPPMLRPITRDGDPVELRVPSDSVEPREQATYESLGLPPELAPPTMDELRGMFGDSTNSKVGK